MDLSASAQDSTIGHHIIQILINHNIGMDLYYCIEIVTSDLN